MLDPAEIVVDNDERSAQRRKIAGIRWLRTLESLAFSGFAHRAQLAAHRISVTVWHDGYLARFRGNLTRSDDITLGVMNIVEDVLIPLVVAWLLFGSAALIAFSRRVVGHRKLYWVLASLAPLVFAVTGAYLAIVLFPQFPFHLHSGHFPAAYFGAVFGTWGVYVFFRRAHASDMTPNPTIERYARKSSARPSL